MVHHGPRTTVRRFGKLDFYCYALVARALALIELCEHCVRAFSGDAICNAPYAARAIFDQRHYPPRCLRRPAMVRRILPKTPCKTVNTRGSAFDEGELGSEN